MMFSMFSKTVLNISFQKLFLKSVFKNTNQTSLLFVQNLGMFDSLFLKIVLENNF